MTGNYKKGKIELTPIMLKKLRPFVSVFLLLAALAIAAIYLDKHQQLIHQLRHIPLSLGFGLLGLYGLFFLSLVFILSACLNICRKSIKFSENAKLNAHTLLLNFFIPGQSGPVYRGLYLLKQHKLKLKSYLVVTALYYLIYAIFSVLMLVGATRPWWQTVLIALLITAAGIIVTEKYAQRVHVTRQLLNLRASTIGLLALATAIQVLIQVTIYGFELHSVNHEISLSQIITYTGAANLALFVSLTPGGIGIRESFLIFTEHLNHIASGQIVLASVIDRSVYLAFLMILITLSLGSHIYARLSLSGKARPRLKTELEVNLAKNNTPDK